MYIDIASYSESKPIVQRLYKPSVGITYEVARIAGITMVPCLAVAYYIAEMEGFSQEAIDKIQSLITFYEYDKIDGKPANAPI